MKSSFGLPLLELLKVIVQKIGRLRYEALVLFLILFLGVTLRLFNIAHNPPGFFSDEASIGYNAYSLLHTGKDEYGMPFPIFFRSFGDYRPPIAVYTAIPFISLFGLNEVSVRLPSVLYGVLTILVMYYIGKELTTDNSSSLRLLTACITATMPWLVHYNRTGFEFSAYAMFFAATILLLLQSLRKKAMIIPAFLIAGCTLYTYQPARLIIPLLLFGFLVIYKEVCWSNKKRYIAGLSGFFILSVPLVISFFTGQAVARFNAVSVFSLELPFLQTLLRILQNYLFQLSPHFFLVGENTFITRHFIGGLTPLLATTLAFVVVGVIYVLCTLKKKSAQLLLYWLLLYPIAGAVTAEPPFTSRAIIGAPLFALLISLGITQFYLYTKKYTHHVALFCILLAITINTFLFAKFYFTKYPLYAADYWGWQYGAKNIVAYFTTYQQKYDDVIMAREFNEPQMFFKFYAPNQCKKCRVGTPSDSYVKNRRQLFAIPPMYKENNPSFTYRPVASIYYPNGTVAFILSEVTQK